jgi:hypothetical protein
MSINVRRRKTTGKVSIVGIRELLPDHFLLEVNDGPGADAVSLEKSNRSIVLT